MKLGITGLPRNEIEMISSPGLLYHVVGTRSISNRVGGLFPIHRGWLALVQTAVWSSCCALKHYHFGRPVPGFRINEVARLPRSACDMVKIRAVIIGRYDVSRRQR